MHQLGNFQYGATIYVPFTTYGASGESITITGLAVTDIEIYKNGNMTQRASDNGYSLLDTDGIDLDGITGIHGFSVDTADNTTAGFFGPGNDYFLVVSAITVNAQTVNFAYHFSIENRHDPRVLARTTIASLSTQTSWTLTAGSADNDAYNDCVIVVHDQASTVQKAVMVCDDYVGSTKTIAVRTDPAIFTMATGDYVTILADRSLKSTVMNRTLDVTATGAAGIDLANVENPTTSLTLSGTTLATSQVVASVTGNVGGNVSGNVTGSVGSLASQAKADVNAEVVDGVNVDTITEQGAGAPPASPTMRQVLSYLYMWAIRNKKTVDASGSPAVETVFADNGSTPVFERDITDAANVTTFAESAAP